jgi:threonine synthase
MSYEIVEQLGWQVPDWVVIPVGAGTLLSGNAKGYFEFGELGLSKRVPHLAGIQAEGCAPLVEGFKRGTPLGKIKTWKHPRTVAGGLVDPYPWDADTAIPALKRSKGTAETVSDAEILEAEKLLAQREGVFAEPSGAAGLAGLKKLLEAGVVDRSDLIVVEITGGGLKDVGAVMRLVPAPPTIEPKLERLKKLLGKKL